MRRVTVSITVSDDWPESKFRAIKNAMIESAMHRVVVDSLNVQAIEAKIGNVRKAKGSS